ncbi:autotransporter-associated beta strand repeat-containing protein [Variovorax sp. ZS18.2.2]|uniref:autotransporter-associated beta strand repeat-containing protein n=1 Tax=Variovorax sp. ZS18.2.2 TaxID=2971255 RepID=UPI0021518C1A|nr:autotransporter-associated beta strand repeat-containing protein [Variovorax sp. ZS18.2.2]MCR6475860.1 autotransporter-associated beta strand repeat-containing protein [Variovorax sp. ZS18.2.2]
MTIYQRPNSLSVDRSQARSKVFLAATLFLSICSVAYGQSTQGKYFNADGSRTNDLEAAAKTWRTPEFLQDHALGGVKAEYAYARGFTGTGVKIGMVDSGALANHPQLQGQFTPLTVTGIYGADGAQLDGSGKTWKKGDAFSVFGNYDPFINDSHGTAAAGEMVAKRNATGDAATDRMHGIAFDAHLYSANSGGTDSTVFGPDVDYAYFKEAYGVLARNGARVVNSSWGQESPTAGDYGTLQGITRLYGTFAGKKTFLDAAAEVSQEYGTIQSWANGNERRNNPRAVSSLPYFRPEIEKYWIAVTGVTKDDKTEYDRCGITKYWCMAGPTVDITTTTVGITGLTNYDRGGGGRRTPESVAKNPPQPDYTDTYNGTSAAAPNVTASLALVMQRFSYLEGDAARDVLFTTAKHLGDGPADVPNVTFGWGKPDLDKAMSGPGQFLGVFKASLPTGISDTWSNNISEAALIQRKTEERTEISAWLTTGKSALVAQLKPVPELQAPPPALVAQIPNAKTLLQAAINGNTTTTYTAKTFDAQIAALNADPAGKQLLAAYEATHPGWQNGYSVPSDYDNFIAGRSDQALAQDLANLARIAVLASNAAIQGQIEATETRVTYLQSKTDADYVGSLIKTGAGTLTLTGDNSYSGGTQLQAGTLGVGSSTALGTGTLAMSDATTLQAAADGLKLANAITLSGIGSIDTQAYGMTLSGAISDGATSGGLAKLGTGTLTLSGANTYSGSTSVMAGALRAGSTTGFSPRSAFVVAANGQLDLNNFNQTIGSLSGAGNVTLGTATLTTGGDNSSTAFSGLIAGAGGLTKTGSGMLSLTGGANALGGDVNVTGGALGIQTPATLDVGGAVSFADNTALSIDTTPTGPSLTARNLSLGKGVDFNLSGIDDKTQANRVLIDTRSGISGDFASVSIGGFHGEVDYLTVSTRKSDDNLKYLASYGLSWSAGNSLAHGTFTLIDATNNMVIGSNLGDKAANAATSWNGKTLTKAGAGTLVLTGTNTYTGDTAIKAGTLQLGNGGTTGSIQGNVANGGVLAFNRSDAMTLAGTISGSGAVNQLGSGTTVLTGTNTYTGGTAINAGTLQLGNGGATGSIQGDVANDGVLAFNRSGATTFAGTISGSGAVSQLGSGTTVLTAANTYTGNTAIKAGTLQLGNGGTTGSIQGHVANDGVLAFNRSDAVTFAGTISGSGAVSQLGSGTTVLTAANTYAGGTALKAGQLNVGHSNALGTGALSMDDGTTLGFTADRLNLANNVVLTGTQDPVIDTGAFTETLGGVISGTGLLTKNGSGVLITTGANTYSGATTVAAGTLQAGAANTFSPASAMTVNTGATLNLAGYSQRVAGMNLAGTVSVAGAAPGTTLTVTGPWTGNGGLLKLGTVSPTVSDRVLLSGTTAVASGTTTVQIGNVVGLGAATTGNGIELIGTTGGASVQGDAFVLAGGQLVGGAYEYRLNNISGGGYLSSSSPQGQVFYRSEVPLYAALPAQLRQASLAMLGNMHQRTGDDDVKAASGSPAGTDGTGSNNLGNGSQRRAWGRLISTNLDIRQSGTVSPQSHGRLDGFQAGTDLLSLQNWRAGVYVGQVDGDMGVSGFARGIQSLRVGRNDLRNQYLGAYGTYSADNGFYADAVLQAGRHRYDIVSPMAQAGSGKGRSLLASVEVGQSFGLGGAGTGGDWKIEPQLQLIHQRLSLDDAAIAGNTVVRQRPDSAWLARLGVRVKGEVGVGVARLQPYARFNLYRASGGNDVTSFMAPGGRAAISSSTGGTSAELAAGATLALTPSFALYGELGKLWSAGGDTRVKSSVQGSVGARVLW